MLYGALHLEGWKLNSKRAYRLYKEERLDLRPQHRKRLKSEKRAGKPTQNGHIASFNGRFREECLGQEWFTSLKEARLLSEKWRSYYTSVRPHSSFGYLPPDIIYHLTSGRKNNKLSRSDWTTRGDASVVIGRIL